MNEWIEAFKQIGAIFMTILPMVGWVLLPVIIVLGILLVFLERFKANYHVVGEKDGFRYYEHKFLRKRTAIRLTTIMADEDWLRFRKDVL